MVLHRSVVDWKSEVGVGLPRVYGHPAIYETYFEYWYCIDLWLIRGWGGLSLPWIYVHSAIYETYVVEWCFIDLWSSRRGRVGLVYHGYMSILLYMELMQRSGVAQIYD